MTNCGRRKFTLYSTPNTLAAMKALAEHERMVLEFGGVVLRYGLFYGPDTFGGAMRPPVGPRIHVAEAARRTVELLEADSGVYEVVEE